jgi:CRISPR-associated protein Csd1
VLSGNNGRVYMRDFLEHSIKDIVERAHQHLKDIALDGKQVSLQSLAWACVGNGSNESPPKPVYRALLRSVIEGEQYPYQAVLTSLGLCLKPEGLRRNRVALIKGYLNRKYRNEGRKEFDVGLNEDATGIGYLLGRLLAVADDIQSASLGHGPNKSFSDRFRGALGATPGLVFHDIMNKVQAHMAKLKKVNPGLQVCLDKKLSAIIEKIDTGAIPQRMAVDQQAEYVLGYYHQYQAKFNKAP